jgi:2-hydroxy-6-oxonona-2,4-dienedioate hydrolase
MINRRKFIGLGLAAAALGGGAGVWAEFAAALRAQRERVGHGSQVLSSRFGQIEYAAVGQGLPVLVAHGAGGGFDQVIAAAGRLVAAGHQIIAPSRFGYLRSASPDDPSPENQADAYAVLLDALAIPTAAVIGVSAGTMSVLQFAARHPDRCRSLTLIVPAASVVGSVLPPPLGAESATSKAIVEYALKSDFIYWLGFTLARDQMTRTLLATDPALVAAASPDERQRAHDFLSNILPMSERSQGLLNDGRFLTKPLSIVFDRIKAPTLIVSLEDDYYCTLMVARVLAGKIFGAQLLTYPSGGHIWVGRDAEMFAAVEAFIRRN